MRIALVRINARRSSLYLSGSTRAAARARARPPARPLRHGALAYPLRNGQTEIFAACARLLCIILNNLPSSSSICLQQHKFSLPRGWARYHALPLLGRGMRGGEKTPTAPRGATKRRGKRRERPCASASAPEGGPAAAVPDPALGPSRRRHRRRRTGFSRRKSRGRGP
ncbi:uncharacterized protein [Struthio camelus]|uniref:uncharacterized protein isoform X6 n=1 Tax=Struthio camelus TaxID=8801 RepID=UPI003603FF6A